MSRRLVGSTLVATSLLIGAASAFAYPVAELPRADCDRRVNDPGGDAIVTYAASGETKVQPTSTSVPGLDIVNVTVRVTADKLEMFLGLKEFPTTFSSTESAYGYEVNFSKGTKNFRLAHLVGNAGHNSFRDMSTPYPHAKAGEGTPSTYLTGVTGEFDTTKAFVIVAVAREQIEKTLGEPLVDGDKFTALAAKTWDYTGNASVTKFAVDTTTTTGDAATFTVGDEYCIGGPPTTLTDFEAKPAPVQFGDAVELSVVLANEADEAVAEREIQFSVAGGTPLKATTTEEGVATVMYPATKVAGTYPVTMTWVGDEEAGKAKLTANITIVPEVTKFSPLAVAKPTKTTRTVTATLLDDDKHAVAGQKVDWYVNGKKAATIATDKAGKSVFKTAKPGQSVQAKLAAVAGKYAAASSNAAKV